MMTLPGFLPRFLPQTSWLFACFLGGLSSVSPGRYLSLPPLSFFATNPGERPPPQRKTSKGSHGDYFVLLSADCQGLSPAGCLSLPRSPCTMFNYLYLHLCHTRIVSVARESESPRMNPIYGRSLKISVPPAEECIEIASILPHFG